MINNSDGTVSFEDATVYSQKGSEFGAKEVNEEREAINQLNTDIVAKNASLEFDSYVESTESYAIVIGNICVVSMCFSVDSFSDVWSDYGIATVIGVVSDCRINSVASIQEKGTCIDVSIDKNTDRISMNARGNADTQTGRNWYRGVLVYPVAHQ